MSLALQVGTNFANDYSDGIRGTDDDERGSVRSDWWVRAWPGRRPVKLAAFASFGVAARRRVWRWRSPSGWQLLVVGAAAIAAGWFYTGGPRPYGYAGFGELFVFVFFGRGGHGRLGLRAASSGSRGSPVAASVPVGLLATALLVINNLRDIPGDTEVGKRTLAVRLGDAGTRLLLLRDDRAGRRTRGRRLARR